MINQSNTTRYLQFFLLIASLFVFLVALSLVFVPTYYSLDRSVPQVLLFALLISGAVAIHFFSNNRILATINYFISIVMIVAGFAQFGYNGNGFGLSGLLVFPMILVLWSFLSVIVIRIKKGLSWKYVFPVIFALGIFSGLLYRYIFDFLQWMYDEVIS